MGVLVLHGFPRNLTHTLIDRVCVSFPGPVGYPGIFCREVSPRRCPCPEKGLIVYLLTVMSRRSEAVKH